MNDNFRKRYHSSMIYEEYVEEFQQSPETPLFRYIVVYQSSIKPHGNASRDGSQYLHGAGDQP